MWKLLIADDEPKIRRGLRKVLDWNELGIEVVGEAEDGEIALSMANELQPDILLVDINMPFLNGLQLIEQLNSVLKDSIVIVITGYDEFDYAQQALRLDVFDYLLKPVIKNEFKKVMEQAIKKLNQERSKNKYINWADKQLKQNIHAVKDSFLNKWMMDGLNQNEIKEQLDFLNVKIDDQSGIFIIKVQEKGHIGELPNQWDKELLMFGIRNIIEELVEEWRPNVVFEDDRDHIIAITPIKKMLEWMELSVKFDMMINEYFDIAITVSQEVIEDGIYSIPSVYQKLIQDMDQIISCTPVVLFAKKYIDTYYYKQDLTLVEVAEKAQVSPTYLSKLLKKELGDSFIDYVTKVRVKKAIQFMNDPTIKIYEVAEQVGYNTQHYFSTAFKKVMGISPVGYKKGEAGN